MNSQYPALPPEDEIEEPEEYADEPTPPSLSQDSALEKEALDDE